MSLDVAPLRARLPRLLAVTLLLGLVLGACTEDERREIRLIPTSTVETGVRILVDNCPGPDVVSLSVRDDVLWKIERVPASEDPSNASGEAELTTADATEQPGLVEFLVGRTPDDWRTEIPLADPLIAGIRYTVKTEPDGQSIDFSTPDLSPGLVWDGEGNAQFNPDLILVECSEPADVQGFAENIVVLAALWITAAAAVMVALILFLFVITRRFSRVRSLQRRAVRDAQDPPTQRPKRRTKS